MYADNYDGKALLNKGDNAANRLLWLFASGYTHANLSTKGEQLLPGYEAISCPSHVTDIPTKVDWNFKKHYAVPYRNNVAKWTYSMNDYEFKGNGFWGGAGIFGVTFASLQKASDAVIFTETWHGKNNAPFSTYGLNAGESSKIFLAHSSKANTAFGDGHVGGMDEGFIRQKLDDSGVSDSCKIYGTDKTEIEVN